MVERGVEVERVVVERGVEVERVVLVLPEVVVVVLAVAPVVALGSQFAILFFKIEINGF